MKPALSLALLLVVACAGPSMGALWFEDLSGVSLPGRATTAVVNQYGGTGLSAWQCSFTLNSVTTTFDQAFYIIDDREDDNDGSYYLYVRQKGNTGTALTTLEFRSPGIPGSSAAERRTLSSGQAYTATTVYNGTHAQMYVDGDPLIFSPTSTGAFSARPSLALNAAPFVGQRLSGSFPAPAGVVVHYCSVAGDPAEFGLGDASDLGVPFTPRLPSVYLDDDTSGVAIVPGGASNVGTRVVSGQYGGPGTTRIFQARFQVSSASLSSDFWYVVDMRTNVQDAEWYLHFSRSSSTGTTVSGGFKARNVLLSPAVTLTAGQLYTVTVVYTGAVVQYYLDGEPLFSPPTMRGGSALEAARVADLSGLPHYGERYDALYPMDAGSSVEYFLITSDAAEVGLTTGTADLELPFVPLRSYVDTAITAQPSPAVQSADEGAPASAWTVAAAGTDLAYQWFRDGAAVDGATAATYQVTATNSGTAGAYAVVVSGLDPAGPVTSDEVRLLVRTRVSSPPAAAARTGDTVTVSWGAPAEAGATVTGYVVELADDEAGTAWTAHPDTGDSLSREFAALGDGVLRPVRVTPVVDGEGAAWEAQTTQSAAAVDMGGCLAAPANGAAELLSAEVPGGSRLQLTVAVPSGATAASGAFVGPRAVSNPSVCGAAAFALAAAADGAVAGQCSATLSFDQAVSDALPGCGFEGPLDGASVSSDPADADFYLFDGTFEVTVVEPAGTVFGSAQTRTRVSSFAVRLRYPKSTAVNASALAYPPAVSLAAVTRQEYNSATNTFTWTLVTQVQYPFRLSVPDGTGSEVSPAGVLDGDAAAVATADTCSGETGLCQQSFTVTAQPAAGVCSLGAELNTTFAISCRDGVADESCDTLVPNAASVQFYVDSDDFCPRVVEVASVTPTLTTYSDSSRTSVSTNYILQTTLFARVDLQIEGGLLTNKVELTGLDIASTCAVGCTDDLKQPLTDVGLGSSYDFSYTEDGVTGGSFHDFSFTLAAGTDGSISFDQDATSGQADITLTATVRVTYTDPTGQSQVRELAVQSGAISSAASTQFGVSGGTAPTSTSAASSPAVASGTVIGVATVAALSVIAAAAAVAVRRRRAAKLPKRMPVARSSSSATFELSSPVHSDAGPAPGEASNEVTLDASSLGGVASAYESIERGSGVSGSP